MKEVYIVSAEQISIQQPLVDDWMSTPVSYGTSYIRSLDPSFKDFITPIEGRRMGKILKRAMATSITALKHAGIEKPDAIITGTGLGCIENTEKFLGSMCNDGEYLLTPTSFMQSTHNTISSLIAIHTHNNGYNATYSHRGISFESALYDAWTQMQLDKITSALVGSHDEVTPTVYSLAEKIGVNGKICGEASVSMVLSTSDRCRQSAMCRLAGIKIMYRPSHQQISDALKKVLSDAGKRMTDIDAVVLGVNGNTDNDIYYHNNRDIFEGIPLIQYKHLFGNCFSASALGVYVAANCLNKGGIPDHLFIKNRDEKNIRPKSIIIFNQSDGKNYSIILLESLCGE